MPSIARTERAALADLLAAVGPDAPTLCEGWRTRDLAAHIVIRERRPDAGLAALLPPTSVWGDRVRSAHARRPWERLVAMVRAGPPWPSPLRIPALDRLVNSIELLVHHEDVRRAAEDWAPRDLPAGVQDALWRRLPASVRFTMRSGRRPCTIALARPSGERVVVGRGAPAVTVTGDPVELLLFAFGRQRHARVTVTGAERLVEAATGADFSV